MGDWATERAALVVRECAELGDRTSPDYDAEIMLLTHDELLLIAADALRDARTEERKAIEARLREPDKAMVEEVREIIGRYHGHYHKNEVNDICRALADVLFPSPPPGETTVTASCGCVFADLGVPCQQDPSPCPICAPPGETREDE